MMVSFPVLYFFTLVACALAANPNKPQGHKGLVAPFKPGTPNVKLTAKDLEKLRKGENVKQQINDKAAGRALLVQDVHAPPEVVWGRILDFPAYTRMVPRVSICENYLVKDSPMQGCKEIYTRMRLTVLGFHVEYFIHHKYFAKLNSVVWTLDYDRESDLDDSVGYWHVIPHPDPDRPHWSRVYYSIDMRLKSWMPGVVKNVLRNQALSQATSWVKKESEKIGVPAHLKDKGANKLGEHFKNLKGGWARAVAKLKEDIANKTEELQRRFPPVREGRPAAGFSRHLLEASTLVGRELM